MLRRLALLALLASVAHAGFLGDRVSRAMRAQDPEERIVRLGDARVHIADADRRERNRAASAIEKGLKKEASPRVRMAAVDFLLALRTDRSLDRLVVAALDRSEEVRRHVQGIVRDRADPMLHAAIVRALREDASWRLRASMVDLLLCGGRASARPPLLETLADPHPAVAARAGEVLERLTGEAFGTDAEMWRAYFASLAARPPAEGGETRTVADAHRKVKLHEGPVRGLIPTLYTIPIREKRVVFVVDMSSSMRQVSRSSHFRELKSALFGLASDVQFNVLCFDQRMFFFAKAKSLVPATVEQKAAAERWVDELPAGERTDVHRSVVSGLAMLKEALLREPKVSAELFILTDGRETAHTVSLRAVEAQYAKLQENRCRIHVVALGRRGTPALRALAERSGGRFVEAPGG